MPSMDDDMKAFLFRAVRELAMNTVKHAEASKMTISIKTYGDRLYVSTTDDGSGFDPKSLEKLEGNRRSFGLFSLRERIISLGGRLVIRSTPGEGTSVKLMVPVGRRNDE
jgi:signal transduction histidine kinase